MWSILHALILVFFAGVSAFSLWTIAGAMSALVAKFEELTTEAEDADRG